MGKVTGFMEYERVEEGYKPVPERVKHYKEFVIGLDDASRPRCRARAAWTAARRSATAAARSTTSFRTSTTWCTAGLEERLRGAGLDQQLPRVHRPHLPRALRGGLHAERQRRRGRHQVARARDHRPRLGERLGAPRVAKHQDRQEGGRGRLRPGRHGRRAATGARRPRRDAVREERPHRRPAALRHPRLQDGEDAHRPPRRADEGRGRDLPHRRDGRRRCPLGRAPRSPTGPRKPSRPSSCRRTSTPCCSPAAPSSRATCRCPAATSTASTSRWSSCRSRTSVNAGDKVKGQLRADGKHVIVIGGGDTGSDCVGTSNRHGATQRRAVRADAAAARGREQAR
jgi:glutamate synthase (NADPH/NADH) small chain